MVDAEDNELNKKLLKAMVSGGATLNFAEKYYLQQFVYWLRPSFKVASRMTLTDNCLVQSYIEAMSICNDTLESLACCTLLWDGWSNIRIYALMVLHDYDHSQILEFVNISNTQPSVLSLHEVTENIPIQSAVDIKVIKWIVTDSPNIMLKYHHEMRNHHKHMVTLPCALHVANTFMKDMHAIDDIQPVVHANCRIVNFLTESHKWFAMSNELTSKKPEDRYTFQVLCKIRWYTTRSSYCMQYWSKELLTRPKISDAVLVEWTQHCYADNHDLIAIIHLVADLIGHLEEARTNLGDIVVELEITAGL